MTKLRRTAVALLLLVPQMAGAPAFAVNWEGHDDWFLGSVLIEAFTKDLPPPLARPMPHCSERRAQADANSYEQVPVPGLNCRAGRKSAAPPAR